MTRKPGRYDALPCADWDGEWAWGNCATEADARKAIALLEGEPYHRRLIDPSSRDGQRPPGEWCVIWRQEAS